MIPDLFGNGGQITTASGSVSISSIFDLLGSRNSNGNAGANMLVNVAGASSGVQGDANTGHLYAPGSTTPYDPAQGLGASRYPMGAMGGNGYSGGGYGGEDTDPDSWLDDSNLSMGKGLKHNSNLAMAREMERDAVNYALSNIPGYDLIPALTGQDAFGCDLTAFERWMKALNGVMGLFQVGHGLADMGGPTTEMLAGGEVGGICHVGCFLAGTPVWVVETGTDGKEHLQTKPIEQIKPGERVISRDESTCKTEAKKVQNTTIRQIDRVVKLTLADARTGKTAETITTTKEHPFYVKDKGFTPAGKLAIGNAIITRAGPTVILKAIRWQERTEGYTVYNLIVDEFHTYFVGYLNSGVWVHNNDECGITVIGRNADVDSWLERFGTGNENIYRPHPKDFTLAKNRAWLKAAVDRGDTIVCASDPWKLGTKYAEGTPNGFYSYRELQWLKKWGKAVRPGWLQ